MSANRWTRRRAGGTLNRMGEQPQSRPGQYWDLRTARWVAFTPAVDALVPAQPEPGERQPELAVTAEGTTP